MKKTKYIIEFTTDAREEKVISAIIKKLANYDLWQKEPYVIEDFQLSKEELNKKRLWGFVEFKKKGRKIQRMYTRG